MPPLDLRGAGLSAHDTKPQPPAAFLPRRPPSVYSWLPGATLDDIDTDFDADSDSESVLGTSRGTARTPASLAGAAAVSWASYHLVPQSKLRLHA